MVDALGMVPNKNVTLDSKKYTNGRRDEVGKRSQSSKCR